MKETALRRQGVIPAWLLNFDRLMIGHRAQCSQYPNAALPRFQHLPSSMHSQVDVSVPNSLATSSHPCPLRLEMWQQDTLLCDSCMLLLPSSMLDVAAELHCLPRTTSDDGNECVTLYVADLANWLHFYHLSNMSSTSSPSTEQWRTSAWGVGVLLVRQAVLWGMPALSTLLVDSLMALPPASLPPSPFAQLAQAHNSSASEDVTVHLGGLLHLSLLSPNSTSMMWVVLDWGRRFGGQGGQGRSEEDSASAADRNAAEAGSFAWCWEERNAADQQTPLDLLAALPQGAAAVQHLLEDPLYEPSVQHAKSLARAHGVPPKTSITTTTSLPPSSGKGRASSAGGGGVEGQSAWKLLGWSACESEASYRDWVKAKGVFHMKACSWFNVLHLCTMLVRAFLHEQLHTDLPCLMTLLLPYAVAAFVISIQPKTSEVGGFVSSNVWWVFGSPRDRQTAKDFGRGFLSSCEW